MVTYSILLPTQSFHPGEILATARLVAQTPGCRLWIPQTFAVEPHQVFAYCAGAGISIPMGTAVTLMPLRHPLEAAVQAQSLARMSGMPFVAGYGPGSPEFQAMTQGAPYPRQLSAVEEYLSTLRGVLYDPELSRTLGISTGTPQVELGLGVLRPGMARLAGRIADVAITWLCPPAYIENVLLSELRQGAEPAGRATPRVAAVVHLAQSRPGRDPVEYALSVSHRHLQSQHYTDMLGRAGVSVDPADPESGARTLVESGVFVTGTPENIVRQLASYEDAGVDEVILNLSAIAMHRGVKVALRELTMLLADLVPATR